MYIIFNLNATLIREKPCHTPMQTHLQLDKTYGQSLPKPTTYARLV